MNILKIKQYGQSSNQNLIMTRGIFNKTFTSAAIVLQFEKQHTCKINNRKSFNELAPECSCSCKNFGVCYIADRSQ